MRELEVRGEIKALAWREGSSGVFSGSIEGLYQGYRFASTTPDERRFVMDLPHGSLALVLHQEISTFLPPRPAEHPFAGGRDPRDNPARSGGPPPGFGPPRPGMPPGGGETPAAPHARPPHYMKVTLRADAEASSGIFAGTTGEVELEAPQYQMGGYLVINTAQGDLRLDFLEALEPGDESKGRTLAADLQVDSAGSTGIYRGARGALKFALAVAPVPPPPGTIPNLGVGPYWGTIWLADAAPG